MHYIKEQSANLYILVYIQLLLLFLFLDYLILLSLLSLVGRSVGRTSVWGVNGFKIPKINLALYIFGIFMLVRAPLDVTCKVMAVFLVLTLDIIKTHLKPLSTVIHGRLS